ncbi:putative E3 ubiquitin-protein ligase MARCH10 [Dissostichus eleginoides]|uniref:RING-type E3 ubiquitin transferase n=1 Tax=Dissostichus eleginoides TaxID=100907 RepID=A0AAD9EU86_DISEL|nr:putative E3 ubiquitin-protein ligase MARCH10 [Dissostichus eleginoides]
MFWFRKKKRDSALQDQRLDREKVDTEAKEEVPSTQASSTLSPTVSPERSASKLKSSPCSAMRSACLETGRPCLSGRMDFVEADSIDSQNLTAELATTSMSPLTSRLNGESLVHSHNKHRCEHVKDGGLNGSTQGEASGQTQSRDFLRRNSKMKRLFNKTNTEEIIDSEHPASTETQVGFLGETTAVPHLPPGLQPYTTAWQAFNEARPGTSTLLNNLPVDDKKLLTDIKENTSHEKHVQERQAAQEGATAAQSPPSLRDIIQETVCRLNKRLSDESTEEEEEDQCRICHGVNTSPENPLVSPCKCRGSVHYLHLDCLKQWTRSRIERGTGPYTVTTCELCKGWLKLDPKLLDFNKYYQEHKPKLDIAVQNTPQDEAELSPLRAVLTVRMTQSCPLSVICGMVPYLIRSRLRERTRSASESSDT